MEPVSVTKEFEGGNSVSLGVETNGDFQADAGNDMICWSFGGDEDTASIDENLLQGLDEIISYRDEFKSKVKGLLQWRRSEKVSTTKIELEAQICSYEDNFGSFRENAIGSLTVATAVRASYKEDRKHGAKKFGRKAQGFVKSFANFLQAYSGIVELLRGAGQVYGEVAYETLSIFFIVVVNKAGNDKKMGLLLADLQKSIPELDVWTNIYDTPPMKMLIIEVYKQIIDFTRTASIYFIQFSTRFWMAIGRPPSMGIDKTATAVYKKLSEVSSHAMIELHKRSHTIHNTVESTRSEVADLKRLNMVLITTHERLEASLSQVEKEYREFRLAVERERDTQDQQSLERLKEKLQITYPSTSTNPADSAMSLEKAFPTKGCRPKPIYLYMTPEMIESLAEWRSWTSGSTTESSLLALAGKTVPEARANGNRGYGHSWLSPAAFRAVQYIREHGGKAAFYCCHPGIRQGVSRGNEKESRHSASEVLASLAYQVLEWQPRVLRKKMAQIEAILIKPKWRTDTHEVEDSGKATLKAAFDVLKLALAGLQEAGFGLVHLVLDRADLVEDCGLRYFMEGLVEMVEDEKLHVKVFVVMDTARYVWRPQDLEEERRVMFVENLNQRKLPRPGLSWP